MLALAILLCAAGESSYFYRHPHLQMFVRELALLLVLAVPIWFIVLTRKTGMIVNFIAAKAYYFLFGLAVVLLGSSELRFFEHHPHWQIFVKEVSFALLIAMLFSFTVERYQREEFVKLVNKERDDLKKDIFVYAYGHDIGDQVREAMKADILKCPFQKENLRIDWEFSEIAGNSEYILLKKRQIYTLRNTTPTRQDYTFRFLQFTASEQDVLVSKVFESLKTQTPTKGHQFKETDLSFTGKEPHERSLEQDFTLGPNEPMEIFFCHTETRRKFGDDSWESIHPIVGVTEIKMLVNEPLRLEISAACKGKPLETTAQHDPPRRFDFRMKEGLLPYQGFAFSWSPVKPKTQVAKGSDSQPAADPATS